MKKLFKVTDKLRNSNFKQLLGNFMVLKERERIQKSAMRFVETSRIQGDYLEFGVSKGSTFSYAYRFAKKFGLNNMEFYAFDSFEGLPEVPKDEKDNSEFKQGMYACDKKSFVKNIKYLGVNLKKVHIVEGWYDKILNEDLREKLPLKKAAIVYIDCDLYESTVPVLKFIMPYLQDGTLIIFDDWYCFRGNPNKGEQKAFYEWVKKNKIKYSEFIKFNEIGNSFIIHK